MQMNGGEGVWLTKWKQSHISQRSLELVSASRRNAEGSLDTFFLFLDHLWHCAVRAEEGVELRRDAWATTVRPWDLTRPMQTSGCKKKLMVTRGLDQAEERHTLMPQAAQKVRGSLQTKLKQGPPVLYLLHAPFRQSYGV